MRTSPAAPEFLSLGDSVLWASEVAVMHKPSALLAVAQGGEKQWCKEQFAEAKSRFNIVTLTMYLIDISFL